MANTRNEILKAYNNRLKLNKSVMREVMSWFSVYVWENKHQKIVTTDRKSKSIITTRLTKRTNLSRRYLDTMFFTQVKSTKSRVELQEYKVSQYIENGQERFSFTLINLATFSEDGIVKLHTAPWLDGKVEAGLVCPEMFFKALSSEWVCKGDMRKVIANGPFKYLDFKNPKSLELHELEKLYKFRDKAEYLQKIGAYDAVADVIKNNVDLRRLSWSFLKKHKKQIKNTNSISLLSAAISKTNQYPEIPFTPEFLRKVAYCDSRIFDTLKYVHKNLNIGYVKLQNYLTKNKIEPWRYVDYIEKLIDMKVNMTKSIVMPKDFKKFYDELNKQRQAEAERMLQQKFADVAKKKSIFNTNFEGLVFIVPSTKKELVKEGFELNNCLSSYAHRLAENKTTVLFVRKEDSPSQPLYALEIGNDNNIVQLRAKNNTDADPKDAKIVAEYVKDYYVKKKATMTA
ncbi:PcfJ domain-containing protein [Limosilactobacillus allomucosae]|uniref:PcfJ domain-containing protein n=1 Tax=Limosilactobacillus allomucosae TaxID=3142938 RepID=UPI0032673901